MLAFTQRTHTPLALRFVPAARAYSKARTAPGPVAPQPKQNFSPPAEYINVKPPTEYSKISGDYCVLGTESLEYYHIDTDPASTTSPYDHPRTSGTQLRYGGKENIPKQKFGPMWHAKEETKNLYPETSGSMRRNSTPDGT